MTRRHLVWLGLAAIGITAMAIAGRCVLADTSDEPSADTRIPMGILGDSDSHSYHDSVLLRDLPSRGGLFRATTYQWTEVIAALRGSEVDMGPWGVWGSRRSVAAFLGVLGTDGRAPRKEDFRFNFAISGAKCPDLLDGPYRQTARLLHTMRKDPPRWARGVVVIRIGVNSMGGRQDLDRYAESGLDAPARERIHRCVQYIRRSMVMIRSEHPRTVIVIAGMSDDRNLPGNFARWRDARAIANISQVLEWHDQSLRALCDGDPRAAFVSDREWFRQIWGARDAAGAPSYRRISFGGVTAVANTIGDHPRNATLSDGHAGTLQNGLWARDLVNLLRVRFAFGITPLADAEIASLADPNGQFGVNARPAPD